MLATLTDSQTLEAMVEHARANLQLQDKKESASKRVITFTGRGISQKDMDVPFALEVVIDAKRVLNYNQFEDAIRERSSRPREERVHTSILFPKSIDYASAPVAFSTPYFRQAHLFPEGIDPRLRQEYERFDRSDVKELDRIERRLAIPLGRSRIAYYNPVSGTIDVHMFHSFGREEVIPIDRPLHQEKYLWRFISEGEFPNIHDHSKDAQIFRNIQQQLHNRIRHIVDTYKIHGEFTLSRRGGIGAIPVSYDPQIGMELPQERMPK